MRKPRGLRRRSRPRVMSRKWIMIITGAIAGGTAVGTSAYVSRRRRSRAAAAELSDTPEILDEDAGAPSTGPPGEPADAFDETAGAVTRAAEAARAGRADLEQQIRGDPDADPADAGTGQPRTTDGS